MIVVRKDKIMELFPKFKETIIDTEISVEHSGLTCKTCKHRNPVVFYTRTIQYCSKIKCNRTDNGMKKIKCKTKACRIYEEL